jgi:hypothetical protein
VDVKWGKACERNSKLRACKIYSYHDGKMEKLIGDFMLRKDSKTMDGVLEFQQSSW